MMQVGGWSEPLTDYFSREISWLAFNARVLSLADDPEVPLLEQVRYLSIFASNLDEFFQVRVSGLADRVAAEITERTLDGHTPAEQLDEVRSIVAELCRKQQSLYLEKIKPALADEGIQLLALDEVDAGEREQLRRRFEERVFPVLTPLAVDPGHPFPFISDLSLNLAVGLREPGGAELRFARVKVPDTLGRWVPTGARSNRFVALEDLIAAHLGMLFPGMELLEHHAFRVTRNADLTLNDEDADDLLIAVEMELRRRRFQWAVRLEVAESISQEMLDLLIRELNLMPDAVMRVRGPIDLTGLNEIAGLSRPELQWPHWSGITEPELVTEDSPPDFFKVLRGGDLLVHHPYSSFSRSVGELIHRASTDPAVLAIKLTLYRTSGDSPIIDALVAAAENGKQVAALVELKARFDEERNISWAKRLEQAGAHVAYGLVGLKIHAKIAMIVREEPEGIRRYCHVGTGNYNHRTARLYEDFGLLTADPGIGADVAGLFNRLTGYGRRLEHTHLITAPEQLRSRLSRLISQEMQAPEGRIVIKLNSLADGPLIEQFYAASRAGVQIDLIVRGLCSLRPGLEGLSENIRVRSIVGRFLEHSRVYHFANADGPGRPATYIGSADLLARNLDRRVETLVRVTDPRLVERLMEAVEVSLSDERLAWTLDSQGVWTRCRPRAVAAAGGNGTAVGEANANADGDRADDEADAHVRLQQLALSRARAPQRAAP
ncbi:MAG: polyphosphate kinase 1 [Acidimicrobiaceae bacterium]|nr:polyphosphate kinase 1 [Acidimicrobiaceae bacterium]MCY4279633.1 polyphosphate kinase 1 [Acidimicrobiaceae bacterium]MCY4294311.1 polyphosphate kinase 1 [Acidimicrobiaceae bacterium]